MSYRPREHDKLIKAVGCGVIAYWIIGAALSLSFTVGLLYVAWHFITKYW
jgi:hypothetical protein